MTRPKSKKGAANIDKAKMSCGGVMRKPCHLLVRRLKNIGRNHQKKIMQFLAPAPIYLCELGPSLGSIKVDT